MKTRHPSKFLGLLASAALAVSTGTSIASGQESPSAPAKATPAPAPEGATVELESYVVTAAKVARPINEVASSVVPISGETLKDLKLFDAKDIVVIAPGLDVNAASPNNTVPSIRGMTFDPFAGTSATVNLYWNELSVDAASAFRAMYDMGQVEVLRGPQGTLRSGSAPGGAILYSTRKADVSGNSSSVQFSTSNEGLFNTQLTANIVLMKEKLALRIAGLYDANDANYAHNLVTGTDSRSHTRSIRATLTWKPNENIDVNLVHQYLTQKKSVGYMMFGQNIFAGRTDLPAKLSAFDRVSIQPSDNLNIFTSRQTSLTVDVRLPMKHELNFIGGLNAPKTTMITSNNRGNLLPAYQGAQYITPLEPATTASYELRFGSVNHKFWNYNIGVFYSKPDHPGTLTLDGGVLSTIHTTPSAEPTTPPRLVITKGSSISNEEIIKAVFTTQSFNLTEKLKLELGLRKQIRTNDMVQTMPLIMTLGSLQIPIGNSNSASYTDVKPTTGSASLSYKFSRNLNTYFSYGRAFRAGGQGTNTNGSQYDKYFHYGDETSDGYELGAKGNLFDRKLQFNVAAFYQKFDGYQALSDRIAARTDLTGNTLKATLGFVTNSPAVVKGLEVNLSYAFPHRLDFHLGASYSQAVWADGVVRPVSIKDASGQYVYNTPGEYVSYASVGGDRIGYAPELTLSPRLDWKKQFGSKEFFVRGLMKYQSNRILVANVNKERVGGYGVCDLQFGLRGAEGNWEVSLWGKNVLGRDAIDYFEDPQASFIWVSGFRQVVTTNPTEVGVTVTRRF